MTHTAFKRIKKAHIPEINGEAHLFEHKKTGARVLSLVNDDENKVFGITFPTLPENSNGVAHILEHSVLCGSRKYPVKEPFVELLKGSLYTFLNALTYPDKTVYPVASTNETDFYHLVDVYLDAVFFPNITPEVLQQEGWHYELDSPEDNLSYKGVVFNEMKGAYSSPERAIYFQTRRSLFPEGLYSVDSGGDPSEIPSLTYEYFRDFHQKYYHPTNAYIFFYGDDNPQQRLKLLDEYLSQFERQEVPVNFPLQKRFESPRYEHSRYIAPAESDNSKKAIVTVNWLLSDTLEAEERLRLSMLDQTLIGTPASPLWKALIDSGLGDDLSAHGLSGSIRELYFSTGLRGIRAEDAEKVETIVIDTLRRLVRDGIPASTIEAAVNTVEFRLRENNTGATPRGLSLMVRALSTWVYGGDPFVSLGFEDALAQFKAALHKNPRLFEGMIETYFLNNAHRTRVLLTPDETLARREAEAEKAALTAVESLLSAAEKLEIVQKTQTLRELQNREDRPEDLAKIPRLRLEDLKKEHTPLPIEVFQEDGAEILYHDLFTNGIVYLNIGFNLKQVPAQLIPYLPLFGRAMLEMGTQKESFVALAERIGRDTGGVSTSPLIFTPIGSNDTRALMLFNAKTTVQQTGKLLDLLRDILFIPNFNNRERFRQMALDARSGMESAVVSSGHGMVLRNLGAYFNESGWFNEITGGFSQLQFLRTLIDNIDNNWDGVLADLGKFHRMLVTGDALVCNVTVDRENWQHIQPSIKAFLQEIPPAAKKEADWNVTLSGGYTGFSIPSKINFVGKAANLFESGYTFHGASLVANKLLRTGWLWNRVRVQGGAYGAMCRFNRRSGVLTLLSYRDPNLTETLAAFDQSAEFLRGARINRDELTKSIIGVIGDLDSYELPDEKGRTSMMRYLLGETDADMQQIRDEVLSTSVEDFRQYADALDHFRHNGIVSVAGDEGALAALGDTLTIVKVL